jgi:5-methylcytosine-specific restriction endonuclease McrA
VPDWSEKFGKDKPGSCKDCGQEIERGIASERGKPTPEKQAQGDHISPKQPADGSIPGNSSPENLQWLCPRCNRTKWNISPEQYYNLNFAPTDATQYHLEVKPTEQQQKDNENRAKEQEEKEAFDKAWKECDLCI